MKHITSFLKQYYGYLFVLCYLIYLPVSWLLVLRDGRAVYTILDFYPGLTVGFKVIEPHLVSYGINSIPTIIFLSIALLMFSLYFFALRQKKSVKKVIFFAIAFQAITFFSYPSLSTDIFSYIFSDRIVSVYHQNVWKTKPITHNADPFSRLSDWQNNTRVYGGVNQAVYTGVSVVGGNNLLLLVMLYKGVAWIFTLATMRIVYLITKKYFSGREAFSLQLIFWNPLFVIEILGSGHNDILMIFFMLVAFYYFLEQKIFYTALAITLGFQIKIIACVLFIFMGIALYQQKKYKQLSIFITSFILCNSIIFALMGIDPLSYARAIFFNTGVYWQGLPALLHRIFPDEKLIIFVGFILTFFFFVSLQLKKKVDPVTLYAGFISVYLLFFASAYWNWYILWALCFVPFITYPRLIRMIIVLSCMSLLLYPTYWIALRFGYEDFIWAFCIYGVLAILPILAFFIRPSYVHYLLKD